MTKKKFLYIILVFVLIAIALIYPNLNITTSSSLDKRVYYRINKSKVEKGDYVSFKLPFLPYSSVKQYIGTLTTKRIACVPGDYLVVQDKYAYCNGVLISIAKDFSLKGEKLENFIFNGEVPKENYFVVGDNPNSLDSRYFGFIKKEEIVGVYIALF